MTNRVTTETLSKIDVAAIAAELAPRLADLNRFLEDLDAQRKTLALFVTISGGAIKTLQLTDGPRAVATWDAMNWKERLALLSQMKTSNDVLARIEQIVDSGPHLMFVTKGMEFVKKAEQCPTLREFAAFMVEAESNRQVKRDGAGLDTIVVYVVNEEVHYTSDTPVTKAAWPYILAVWSTLCEKRDKARQAFQDRTRRLTKEATPGVTLSGIVEDHMEGKIAVWLDRGRSALLEFYDIAQGVAAVEILATNYNRLVWRRIRVDLSTFETVAGYWPSDNYGFPAALREQLKREQRNREVYTRLTPLRIPDLLLEEPEWQSMTRVLLGEDGSALAYQKAFSHNDEEIGFFGITVSGKNGKFVLEAVESDRPFPQQLVGRELPLTVQDQGNGKEPYIAMEFPDLPEDEREALVKVKRLLISRVRLEDRHR